MPVQIIIESGHVRTRLLPNKTDWKRRWLIIINHPSDTDAFCAGTSHAESTGDRKRIEKKNLDGIFGVRPEQNVCNCRQWRHDCCIQTLWHFESGRGACTAVFGLIVRNVWSETAAQRFRFWNLTEKNVRLVETSLTKLRYDWQKTRVARDRNGAKRCATFETGRNVVQRFSGRSYLVFVIFRPLVNSFFEFTKFSILFFPSIFFPILARKYFALCFRYRSIYVRILIFFVFVSTISLSGFFFCISITYIVYCRCQGSSTTERLFNFAYQ